MIKKQSSSYESPQIKMLQFDEEDIVRTSGDNYFEWAWGDEESSNGDDMFS